MKPPPPMLPARGRVTASAKPTATAASTALPPRFSMSNPTRDASASWLTTMPCVAMTGRAVAKGEMIGAGSAQAAAGEKREEGEGGEAEANLKGAVLRAVRARTVIIRRRRPDPPASIPLGSEPRRPAQALPDRHHRAPRETRGELAHVGGGNRDAAGGGRKARAGEMEEDRAAAPLGATGEILVEHESQIVEMIVAPHAVGAVGGGQPHRAIVARARRVLAPALVAPHGLERDARRLRPRAVRPVIAPEQPEPPRRRALVALALDADDSGGPKRAGDAERSRGQPAARAVSGERADAEEGEARDMVISNRRRMPIMRGGSARASSGSAGRRIARNCSRLAPI